MNYIKIIKSSKYDNEYKINICNNKISISTGDICIDKNNFIRLIRELQSFPEKNRIKFEIGSYSIFRATNNYLKIDIGLFKAKGDTFIEIKYKENYKKPFGLNIEFSIICNPSDINELGNKINSFIMNDEEEMNFEFRNS